MTSRTAGLSVVVITLDEEDNLPRCLRSVGDLARQLVVVDSGSSDRTCRIAEEAGAEVVHQPFLGYGKQKQFALDHATEDWVLSLDADEWLDQEARNNIAALLAATSPPTEVTGFRLQRQDFFLGKFIHNGDWISTKKLRLVRHGHGRWSDDDIHESLHLTKGKSRAMGGRILHFPNRDLSHHLRTLDHYTEVIAKRDENTPLPRVWFGMVLEPPLVFLNKYFLQLGILNGLPGFVTSVLVAFYFFLRYAKIWQRRHGLQHVVPEDDGA